MVNGVGLGQRLRVGTVVHGRRVVACIYAVIGNMVDDMDWINR